MQTLPGELIVENRGFNNEFRRAEKHDPALLPDARQAVDSAY